MSWKKYTIEKVTPRFDKTWYIKWIASVLLIINMVMTAARSVRWYTSYRYYGLVYCGTTWLALS